MAWSLVQTAVASNIGTATYAATFTAAVTAGNLVVGFVADGSAVGTSFTSVADNKSNTYTLVQQLDDSADGVYTTLFYLENITNGPTVITATPAAGGGFQGAIIIAEFSGGGSSGTDGNNGTAFSAAGSTTLPSGNITTTQAGDLIIGGACNALNSTVPTVGSGFTNANSANNTVVNYSLLLQYQTQVSAGTIQSSVASGVSRTGTSAVLAFKVAAGVVNPVLVGSQQLMM